MASHGPSAQAAHPLGTAGERLRRLGDACNIMDSPEVVGHKYAVLKKHLAL